MDDELRNQGRANFTIPKELWEKLKPLAQEMRKNPTPTEKRLWEYIRRKQMDGYKFLVSKSFGASLLIFTVLKRN